VSFHLQMARFVKIGNGGSMLGGSCDQVGSGSFSILGVLVGEIGQGARLGSRTLHLGLDRLGFGGRRLGGLFLPAGHAAGR